MRHRTCAWLPVLAAGLLLSGCGDAHSDQSRPAPDSPRVSIIGLATSLPLFWQESASVSDLLKDDRPAHWALGVLRERSEVRPLDSLADRTGALPLPLDGWLILAQPYPLSPQENVALDDWVRAGGRVLLFADPMLTEESAYALGDRRRPQDVILLSPILDHWGLELRFDEDQPPGARAVPIDGASLPVNLSGTFAVKGKAAGCVLAAQQVIATCAIGRGRVVAVADAAVLESAPVEQVPTRKSALHALLNRLND